MSSSDPQNKSSGFGAFSSSASSSTSGSGFSFKPSALAQFTTHINTKVVTTQNADLPENSHTPAVLKFLSSKPEDLLNDGNGSSTAAKPETQFVFGKNIDTRVVNVPDSPPHDSSQNANKDDSIADKSPQRVERTKSPNNNAASASSSNADVKSAESDNESALTTGEGGFLGVTKGLIKSGAAQSESSPTVDKTVFQTPENLSVFNVNRLPQPVPSLETGEENEDTLFHATCKLHVFDGQKNTWLERGRGLVKINRDRTSQKCRIVMRQQGIFRLLMNSGIFAGMRLKQVSARGIHVTAAEVDTGAMRVFLLTSTTPTEAHHLYHYLARIVADLDAEEKAHVDSPQRKQSVEEWHAAEGTRSSKHGRQSGSNSVGNSQEDINRISSSNQGGRSADEPNVLRRGSSGNYIQTSRAYSDNDDDDEEDDGGNDRRAKRALTVVPNHKGTTVHQAENSNSISPNSQGSCSVDSNGISSSSSESEEGLDDSLSSHSTGAPGNNKEASEYSAEASNASLDLKRPRLLKTDVDGVQTDVGDDEGAESKTATDN